MVNFFIQLSRYLDFSASFVKKYYEIQLWNKEHFMKNKNSDY
jgi:hypothetical protein